jgi:hypothetical protein
MKTKLLCLALSMSLVSSAQETKLQGILPMKDGKVNYTDVIPVDSTSKDQLYTRAKRWFAETYKSAKDVIQLDDKENGEIIGKGLFNETLSVIGTKYDISVYEAVKIFIKDNKVKYEITDFVTEAAGNLYGANGPIESFNPNMGKKKFLEKVDTDVQAMIASLKKALQTKTDSNW